MKRCALLIGCMAMLTDAVAEVNDPSIRQALRENALEKVDVRGVPFSSCVKLLQDEISRAKAQPSIRIVVEPSNFGKTGKLVEVKAGRITWYDFLKECALQSGMRFRIRGTNVEVFDPDDYEASVEDACIFSERNGAAELLILPYSLPSGSRVPMGVVPQKPAYFSKVVEMDGKSLSPKELMSEISVKSGVSVRLAPGVNEKENGLFNERITSLKGSFRIGELIQHLISYMEEGGMIVEKKEGAGKQKAAASNPRFRIVARLSEKEIVLDLIPAP
jgi:hypothetical protein